VKSRNSFHTAGMRTHTYKQTPAAGQRDNRLWRSIRFKRTVKVKLSLALISYALRHEDAWRSGGTVPLFLASAPDGGEWSASRPGATRHTDNPANAAVT
jgi:hypothetical protein